jgi:threonine synthase
MYLSTRSKIKTTSSKAILKGLSDDGGLFVLDQVDSNFFNEGLLSLSYQELAVVLLTELLNDYSVSEIIQVVNDSYNNRNFPNDIVKLKEFDTHSYLELYHGNTFAFKDMALSVLPNLLQHAKTIQGDTKKTVILTATSGDTGSAALNGFSNGNDTYVIVLYPTKGVSEFQELQMNAFQSETNIVIAVDGNFDDCQNIVKELFSTLSPNHISLSSANSINIGRIIPQVIYYLYSYLQLVKSEKITFGEEINVTVPTGNFGNIYAAYIAKKMGTPIHKLVIASNSNNVLTDIFNNNTYNTKRKLKQTISPSMDILISSNVERYLFELLESKPQKLKNVMETLKTKGSVSIPDANAFGDFYALFATEEETYQEIKETFTKYNYLIDPHTAVARFVSKEYIKQTNDARHMLVVSTANPYKFTDAVLHALELEETGTILEKFDAIERATKISIDERMKNVLTSHNEKIEVSLEEAYEYVKKVIGDLDDKN